jgi:hypothetical protein
MVEIVGPPSNVIRNRPITTELRGILESAAVATGIHKITIVSGGQTSNHIPSLKKVVGGWTGSRRHDNGRAADIMLKRNGNVLKFTNNDGSQVASFISAVATRGATGIGAATDYMGDRTIHVGFGNSVSNTQKLVWGRNGASANAPQWLRQAAAAGWSNQAFEIADFVGLEAGNTHVTARDGVWLRKGPGLEFGKIRLLSAKTKLTVVGTDGDWSRVDLEGDNLVDGHIHSSFLTSDLIFENFDYHEDVEEPSDSSELSSATLVKVSKRRVSKKVKK